MYNFKIIIIIPFFLENSSEDDGKTSHVINQIVNDLKLENPSGGVIELVDANQDSSESILPHVNIPTLEYATQTQQNDRDPLEVVDPPGSDTL